MKRTLVQFANFLADYCDYDSRTMGNIVRRCRESDLIGGPGKGRGAPAVTSEDAARVLIAVLATDSPVEAPRVLPFFGAATTGEPSAEQRQTYAIAGLPDDWFEGQYVDVLTRIIDARRQDENFDMKIVPEVRRGSVGWPMIFWMDDDAGRVPQIWYDRNPKGVAFPSGKLRQFRVTVMAPDTTLLAIADYLEGRQIQPHSEDRGPDRRGITNE
jgi:hypothetical protein